MNTWTHTSTCSLASHAPSSSLMLWGEERCTCSNCRSMDVTWSWAMCRCDIACAWHVSSSIGQDCSRKNHCHKPKLIAFTIETHSGSSPHPPWGCQAVNSRYREAIFASHFFASLYTKEMWCKYGPSIPRKMWQRNVMQIFASLYQRNVVKKCDANMASLYQRNVAKKCEMCKYMISHHGLRLTRTHKIARHVVCTRWTEQTEHAYS